MSTGDRDRSGLAEPAGRGVRLTPQARILVEHIEAILERLEEAEADLRAPRWRRCAAPCGSPLQSVLFALVPSVLTRLAGRHPRCVSRSRTRMQGRHSRACSRTGACAGNPGRRRQRNRRQYAHKTADAAPAARILKTDKRSGAEPGSRGSWSRFGRRALTVFSFRRHGIAVADATRPSGELRPSSPHVSHAWPSLVRYLPLLPARPEPGKLSVLGRPDPNKPAAEPPRQRRPPRRRRLVRSVGSAANIEGRGWCPCQSMPGDGLRRVNADRSGWSAADQRRTGLLRARGEIAN